MRILIVSETLLVGGAEWFTLRLASSLVKENHKVKLYVIRTDLITKGIIEQFPDVPIIGLPKYIIQVLNFLDRVSNRITGRQGIVNLLNRLFLRHIFQQFHPDVIHSHLLKVDDIIIKANKKKQIKHVITIHGDYIEYIKTHQGQFFSMMSRVFQKVNSVVVITEEQKKILCSVYPVINEKLSKIYNGYHLPPLLHQTNNTKSFVFGMIARGIPEKGWQCAIDAFQNIKGENFALHLVGDSKYLTTLKDQTNDCRIHFLGSTTNPLEAIRHFDVGLFPSYYESESLPTTIIEYLVLHKPIITTDIGECRNMISNGSDIAGIIIPFESDGQPSTIALTEAMLSLKVDDAYYAKAVQIASLCKSKFDMKKCMSEYLKIYNS